MIPYFEIPAFTLWGVVIHPFGALGILGCLSGFFAARWYGKTHGLSTNEFEFLVPWTFFCAYWVANIVTSVLKNPLYITSNVWHLFDLKQGISSFGIFLGGGIGMILYLKLRKLSMLEYGDALVFGLSASWFFLRLGCSIAHDHPGSHTDFFLAVRYPDGPRHDLGFYEWLLTIAILGVMLIVLRRNPPAGILMATVSLIYGPARFFLDFLRVVDTLYFGLTLGQYFALLLFATGVWLVIAIRARTPRFEHLFGKR